jgi:serine/alanine adding enzyme
MTLRVSAEFPGDQRWDAFVRQQPEWSHCHLAGWRTVMREVFGHECIYLTAATDDEARDIRGVLPLVRVKSAVFGHFLVSMPFLNHGGPLGSSEAVQLLTDHATRIATDSRAYLLELRSRTPLEVGLPASHHKITVDLDIPAGGSQQLFKSFESRLRSQIRRPTKSGITMRFGPDQLAPFYKVFAHHMRDLGTPAQPRRFFETIQKVFGDSIWFGCAYLGEVPVAAGCALRWGDEIEMTWASSLRQFNSHSPNMLVYWSFMERAADQGVQRFGFGRCTPGSNTHRFKLQWGARDRALWWYHSSTQPDRKTPAPSDKRYAWGTRVWRALPVRVATAIGPAIVRYIP